MQLPADYGSRRSRSSAPVGAPLRRRHPVASRFLSLATLAAIAWAPTHAASAQTAPAPTASERPAAATVDAYRVAARARAALDLLRAGQPDAASTQLHEAEQGPLKNAGKAQQQLASTLARLGAAVADDDVATAKKAAAAVASAADALRSGAGGSPAALVAALVRDASSEGQEAAGASGPDATEPHGYALALCELATGIASRQDLPSTVKDAVTTLGDSIRNRAGAGAIGAAGATALAALGAPPSAEEVTQAFDAIRHDLDLAVARYRKGDAAGTQEALVSAYLDHFEGLEPALRKLDPKLERSLEATLARHLRQLVREAVPPSRFAAAVARAGEDLQTAREALE